MIGNPLAGIQWSLNQDELALTIIQKLLCVLGVLIKYKMAQKRRRSDQILTQILATCHDSGASKTKIVYASNLNFKTVNLHLNHLIANRLLEAKDGPIVLYVTTEKGEQVLEHLKEIERLMPIAAFSSQEKV